MVLDEEAQARADVWKFCFGFVNTRVVECAVQLEIPDILENHGGPMSLSDLSAAVGCPPDAIYRIMRFLSSYGIFKKIKSVDIEESLETVHYVQTPLSRLFMRDKLAPFMLLHRTPPGQSGGISPEAMRTGHGKTPELKAANGEDSWTDPACGYHDKLFSDAMASHAKVTVSAMIENYADGLKGIGTLVDVGGRHGTALGMLVDSFPGIRGICFDLPEIVAKAPSREGIEFIGGSMFERVPKADTVMLMWILHDWSDELCIEILKKCKEAVPSNTGKVIIVDAIIDEEGEGDEYTAARLALDMVMMAVTVNGKERTYKEWAHLLGSAGFTKYAVKNIKTIESVIEAYP